MVSGKTPKLHLTAASIPIKAFYSPAELRPVPMADGSAETDLEYFVARPHARHRVRPAHPGEFTRFLIVIATATRDDDGRPTTISRSLYRYDGGHA